MLSILKKAKLAIKSRIEYNEELTDLQKKRLSVCKPCPYNSDNKLELSMIETMMFRMNKILNFIMGVKVTEDAICTVCTCNLIFKSSQEDPENMCPKGKWNNI
jgi:protein-arginine kinase activator protein McsA